LRQTVFLGTCKAGQEQARYEEPRHRHGGKQVLPRGTVSDLATWPGNPVRVHVSLIVILLYPTLSEARL
jgi:hypothetical protein